MVNRQLVCISVRKRGGGGGGRLKPVDSAFRELMEGIKLFQLFL